MTVLGDPIKKVSSKDVAFAICDAMGLPTNGIQSIVIDVTAKQPPSVTIRRLLRKQDLEGLTEVINNYHFVEFVLGKEEGSEDDE